MIVTKEPALGLGSGLGRTVRIEERYFGIIQVQALFSAQTT